MKKKYTQKTLKSPAHLNGIGVHSGTPVNLELLPAAINHGIKFQRTDIATNNIINATYDCVSDTKMSTTLSNKHGATFQL